MEKFTKDGRTSQRGRNGKKNKVGDGPSLKTNGVTDRWRRLVWCPTQKKNISGRREGSSGIFPRGAE